MMTLPSAGHCCILFAITLFRNVRDVVVQSTWGKGVAHCEQSVHPIGCLAYLEWKGISKRRLEGFMNLNYLIVLITSCVVLSHPHDEVEDCHKGTDGIWIASEHDITETNIVVGCDMASCHPCERRLQEG